MTHNHCTIQRIKVQEHWSWNLETGEKTFLNKETVTEPCGVPLFSDMERKHGICRSCSQGWEAEGNRFASDEEERRATERNEFLCDIIVTAVEGGISYWAKVKNYIWSFRSLGDGKTDVSVEVQDLEAEDPDKWVKVTPWVIEQALEKFRQPMVDLHDDYRKTIVGADATNDAEEIDSIVADIIVQVAVLGEVPYG